MKHKKSLKPLSLKKQTISNLNVAEMRYLRGGGDLTDAVGSKCESWACVTDPGVSGCTIPSKVPELCSGGSDIVSECITLCETYVNTVCPTCNPTCNIC